MHVHAVYVPLAIDNSLYYFMCSSNLELVEHFMQSLPHILGVATFKCDPCTLA